VNSRVFGHRLSGHRTIRPNFPELNPKKKEQNCRINEKSGYLTVVIPNFSESNPQKKEQNCEFEALSIIRIFRYPAWPSATLGQINGSLL